MASAALLVIGALPAAAGLDRTFSDDGIFIPDVGGGISDLEMDGTKLVAAGHVDTTPVSFAAFRLTSNGKLDTSFSGDGIFTLAGIGGSGVGIVRRAGGGYWVGGSTHAGTMDATWEFALVALTAAGEIDTSVGGGDGLVTVDLGGDDVAAAMTLDPSGRILLAGQSTDPHGATSSEIGVVRLTSAGEPDSSFGGDGGVSYPGGAGEYDGARGIATTAAGQPIVVGASAGSADGSSQLVLARLEEDGDLDPTFGDGGMAMPDLAAHSEGAAVEVVTNGKIVVGATVWGNATTPGTHIPDLMNFAVARLTPDGSLDDSFGTGGAGYTVTSIGTEDRVSEVAIFSDESILVVGSSEGLASDQARVRYTKHGVLDPLFAKQTTNLWKDQFGNNSDDLVMALLIMPDDRYVLGGTSWVNLNGLTGYRVALARYTGAGLACTKIGTGGNDSLRGTARRDVLCGMGGKDVIRGAGGADRIYGGPGNDSLYGGVGNDALFGEAGSDLMNGGDGRDVCRDRTGRNRRISC